MIRSKTALLTLSAIAAFGVLRVATAQAAADVGGKDGGSVEALGGKDGGSVEALGGKDGGSVEALGGKDGGAVQMLGGKDGGN